MRGMRKSKIAPASTHARIDTSRREALAHRSSSQLAVHNAMSRHLSRGRTRHTMNECVCVRIKIRSSSTTGYGGMVHMCLLQKCALVVRYRNQVFNLSHLPRSAQPCTEMRVKHSLYFHVFSLIQASFVDCLPELRECDMLLLECSFVLRRQRNWVRMRSLSASISHVGSAAAAPEWDHNLLEALRWKNVCGRRCSNHPF